jgi:hypothetical protein
MFVTDQAELSDMLRSAVLFWFGMCRSFWIYLAVRPYKSALQTLPASSSLFYGFPIFAVSILMQ